MSYQDTIFIEKTGEDMQKITRKELILEGNLNKAILTLSFPIMINNFIQTLYNLADGLWVTQLGLVEFAATSFVWPVNFLFISLGFGLSIAATSILSQLVGADKLEEANEYASQIMVMSVIVSVVFAIMGYFMTPFIVKAMGAKGQLLDFSITYLRLTFLDMPFMFIYYNINSILTAEGNVVTPMILSGISALINIILDPIMIFGWFGFPAMGIAGAAIATVISRVFLAIAGILFIKYKNTLIKLKLKNFKFDKTKLKKILKVALPSSIGQSGSALGFMVLNGFIVSFGDATVTAYAMVNRITSLVMQPTNGIGAALTTIMGQNMGSGNLKRAKEGFRKSVIFTLILSAIFMIILFSFDTQVIKFFMQNQEASATGPIVLEQGLEYLMYSTLFIPLMGLFSIFQGVFQGSGHTKYSMYMEIGRLWIIRLPMILLFKNFTDLGPTGVWLAMSASNLIVCVYGFIIYKSGKWENSLVRVRN